MHCKFKVGDYVERIGSPNGESMPVGWRGEVTGIVIEHGQVWLYFDNKPRGVETYFKRVKEKANTPEIAVGSKWSFVEDKSLIVSVVHVNNHGTIVLKVEQRGNSYHEEEDNGLYDTGNIFVYGEDEEAIPFTDCYTPYIEPKTIVAYVGVVKNANDGSLFFTPLHHGSSAVMDTFERYWASSGKYSLITIKEVKYTEGEE